MKQIRRHRASLPAVPNALVVISLMTVTLFGVREAKSFFVPVLMAALLAFMLSPLVRILKKWKVPEWLAVVLASIILFIPIAGSGYLFVVESEALVRDYPGILDALKIHLQELSHSSWAIRFNLNEYLDFESLVSRLGEETGQGIHFAVTSLTALFSAGSHSVLVALFAIVMLVCRVHMRAATESIMGGWKGFDSETVIDEIVLLIQKFLLAKLLLLVIVGVADLIVLKAFNVRYAFSLAGVLGLLTLLPAIGFFIGVIPVIIVCLATGHEFLNALLAVISLGLVSTIEAHFLTPKLVGKKLNLNLLATFIGLFAGERLWGIWGMFLSIPIMGVLRISLSATPGLEPWGVLLSEKNEETSLKKLAQKD